eukprot:g30747.t1
MVAITKEKVLGKLKGDKSLGPDGLHPRVLKEIAEEILETLMVIFQELLESGRAPDDRKITNVTLFNKEVSQKMGNYRLISLTSVAGKIVEPIVKDEISEYLEVHDEGTEGILAKFAYDTKIGGGTRKIKEEGRPEEDLDRKDVPAMEQVQRRFTRTIPEMKGLLYEERLRTLGLYLEFRRVKGDLIETYRILKGL